MIKIKSLWACFGGIAGVLLLTICFPQAILFNISIVLFAIQFIYCLKEYQNHIVLLAFLLCFFTFILGGECLQIYFGYEVLYSFSGEINNHSYLIILISLISLYISYFFFYHKTRVFQVTERDYSVAKYKTVRKVSKIIFYITAIPLVITTIEKVLFVQAQGYSALYMEYTGSSLPYFLQKVGDMSICAYYIFLATMPSKKESLMPNIFYLGIAFLGLFTGQRSNFIIPILIFGVYIVLRQKYNPNGEKWIGKKTIVFAVLAVPTLIALMYFYSFIRMENQVTNISLIKGFLDFFEQQGFSINVIKWEKCYENMLPNKIYSLGQLTDFLSNGNFISRFLFDIPQYLGQSVERAVNGNQMSHALTYLVYPWSYLNGYGVGSCYMAELYHDFSYFGLVIGNGIYGFVLSRITRWQSKNIWLCAISYIMLSALFMAPRGYTDSFLSNVLDFSNIEMFLLVGVISYLLTKRRVR